MNQYAIQDQNRFPAMTGHSGTSNDAEVRRMVVGDYGETTTKISDASGQASVTVGHFGELLTSNKEDQVNVIFKYPYYNTEFDMKPATTSGDGTVTVSNSLLQVSSTATGTAISETKHNIRYKAGHTGYADFTASFEGTGTSYAGAFDSEDGFFIKVVNGTPSIGRMYDGVETGVTSDFNGNADTIDWTKINVFRILFGYLGAANCVFQIRQNGWKNLHVIETEGKLTTPIVKNPSFPFRFSAYNGSTVKTASLNGGLLNVQDTSMRYFNFAGSAAIVSTTLKTAVHFRNKTTYKTETNKNIGKLLKLKMLLDPPASGTGTIEIKFYKNSTLSGTPTYADVDTNNSTMEYSVNASYLSGGKLVFTDFMPYSSSLATPGADTGGSDTVTLSDIGLYLLPGETMTVTAQNVYGSTNVTLRLSFNWVEEY